MAYLVNLLLQAIFQRVSDDYPAALRVMVDAALLPRTYDVWLEKAERLEAQLTRDGAIVVRAPVDPKTFAAWCAANALNVDAKGRNRWASEFAFRYLKDAN